MPTEILLNLGLFILSLAVLLKASDWFVDAAEKIGLSLGISPFIVGVTIIAFGTSLPELAASIAAVFAGESEVVVGNVVGSNITNILLVFGLVAIVAKEIILDPRIIHLDIPLLAGSAFLLWFVLYDQQLSFPESIILLVALALFLFNTFRSERSGEKSDRPGAGWKSYVMLLVGGALVYLGATYTILAIQKISEAAQISSGIIALSLVALGTSLPEVVVSVTAARKGKAEMAIGNILGSNLFNTYAVMGIPSFFGPLDIPQSILEFSLPFMVAVTVLLGFICFSQKVSRYEGSLLILFYVFFFMELVRGVL